MVMKANPVHFLYIFYTKLEAFNKIQSMYNITVNIQDVNGVSKSNMHSDKSVMADVHRYIRRISYEPLSKLISKDITLPNCS